VVLLCARCGDLTGIGPWIALYGRSHASDPAGCNARTAATPTERVQSILDLLRISYAATRPLEETDEANCRRCNLTTYLEFGSNMGRHRLCWECSSAVLDDLLEAMEANP
jgi:hypothetical protein